MNNATAFHHVSRTNCPYVVSTTFIVVLSKNSFLALAGNLLLITSFIKTRRLEANANYYIVKTNATV